VLRQRLLSAAFLIPLVAALVWLGPWTSAALLALVSALGGWELYRLLRRLGWPAPCFLPGLAVAIFAASLAGWLGRATIPLAVAAWIIPLVWLFRPRVPANARPGIAAWGVHLLGSLYLGLFPAYLARLERGPWSAGTAPGHSRWVFFALLVIWACDTGAYASGYFLGRRKLWPSVSPKKTWEGAWGGLLASALLGALLARPLAGLLHPGEGALLGAMAAIAGQLGDLIESRVKRLALVKDSSGLIPGHGGVLDRLDSLLFAAPLFYYGLNELAR
jgi:phosphatidate cytidylyltransferase